MNDREEVDAVAFDLIEYAVGILRKFADIFVVTFRYSAPHFGQFVEQEGFTYHSVRNYAWRRAASPGQCDRGCVEAVLMHDGSTSPRLNILQQLFCGRGFTLFGVGLTPPNVLQHIEAIHDFLHVGVIGEAGDKVNRDSHNPCLAHLPHFSRS